MGASLLTVGYIISKKRNYPYSKRVSWSERFSAFISALPAMLTPGIILGGILTGVFTPTEAAGIAVLYALVLGMAFYREVTPSSFVKSLLTVTKNISAIMIIVGSAAVFGWILAYVGIPGKLAEIILGISQSKFTVLLILNILLLMIGCFMETLAVIMILVPMLMPVIDGAGIDRVHFGVVMAINLSIGMITPPVGVCLYIVANIGKISFESVIKAIWPLLAALMLALALTTYVPPMTLWLPCLFL